MRKKGNVDQFGFAFVHFQLGEVRLHASDIDFEEYLELIDLEAGCVEFLRFLVVESEDLGVSRASCIHLFHIAFGSVDA